MTIERKTVLLGLTLALFSCEEYRPTSDDIQRNQQERILQEGTSSVGMPAITKFREKRLLKAVLELRDQENLSTFTYVWSDMQGKPVFLCNSIGFGIPYATQFTNPQKLEAKHWGQTYGYYTLPQADPNGLFSPASADGTWVMCTDPTTGRVSPQFIEPRVIVSTFALPNAVTHTSNVEVPPITIKK